MTAEVSEEKELNCSEMVKTGLGLVERVSIVAFLVDLEKDDALVGDLLRDVDQRKHEELVVKLLDFVRDGTLLRCTFPEKKLKKGLS